MKNTDELIREYYTKMQEPKKTLSELKMEYLQHELYLKKFLNENKFKVSDDTNEENEKE